MLIGYTQSTFVGLNMKVDTSLLGNNQYPLLVNGRIRDGVVSPIKSPVRIGQGKLPQKLQGIYGIANFLLVFGDGKAFVRDINNPNLDFFEISDFQLSPDVDTIYAVAVPESYVNYARQAVDDTASTDVVLSRSKVNHSPAVVVCQDGINQPWLIFPNGYARRALTFDEWTVFNREYVPIGKQMLYFNGKLYIVSSDGKRIYHSVTGRPLDFVIVVDKDGNKIAEQDAVVTSWSVNYEPISAIRELSSTKEEFFVCTERASYMVRPNYDRLFCGEPLFSNQYLFSTGAKNQFSIVDILGDTVLIDFGGIKTFNSIMSTQNEGKNSPFSAIISRLFTGIEQTTCAAFSYDNYAFFSVNTIYGNVIVVFDSITNSFVSIDEYSNVEGSVVQFAEVITNVGRNLYFRTDKGHLYEAFVGPKEEVGIYVGDFTNNQALTEQLLLRAKLTFLEVKDSGTVFITPYVDGAECPVIKKNLLSKSGGETTIKRFPFKNGADNVRTLAIDFTGLPQGWKVGLWIRWKFDTSLSFVQLICDTVQSFSSNEQTVLEYAHLMSNRPTIDRIEPSTGKPRQIITFSGNNLLAITDIQFNDVSVDFNILDNSTVSVVGPDKEGLYIIKLVTPTGAEYLEQTYVCSAE